MRVKDKGVEDQGRRCKLIHRHPKPHHLLFRQTRQKTNAESRFLPKVTCNADKYYYNHLEGIKESALGVSISPVVGIVRSSITKPMWVGRKQWC